MAEETRSSLKRGTTTGTGAQFKAVSIRVSPSTKQAKPPLEPNLTPQRDGLNSSLFKR